MLISEEVEVQCINTNKKYYIGKDYPWQPKGIMIVKVEDLSDGSHATIEYLCDYCLEEGVKTIVSTDWRTYNKHKNNIINKDACKRHIFEKQKDIGIFKQNEKIILPKDYIANYYIELYYKLGFPPKTKHINEENKFNPNFPSFSMIRNTFGNINNLKNYCNISIKVYKYTENELLNLLTEYINKYGYPEDKRKTFRSKNNLPAYKVYSERFGDNLADIIELCGFKLSEDDRYIIEHRCRKNEINKEQAINIIYKMQKQLDVPLIYDDFRGSNTKNHISINDIIRIWGSMNNMKEELGLIINQESMIDKMKSKEEMLEDMKFFINQLNRLPSTKEINENKNMLNCTAYHRYFGGINNVFMELGYIPNKKLISLHMTNEDIINIYKEFIEDKNITPSYYYCQHVYKLPSPKTIIRRFNCSWNEFILMLGFEPNEQNKYGTICNANDGTLCFSTQECIIHNYFLKLDLQNLDKECLYRDFVNNDTLINICGYKRCDWMFEYNNKVYIIEYFSLIGNKKYEKRVKVKIDIISKAKLQDNFIALYPKDINKLDEIFGFMK